MPDEPLVIKNLIHQNNPSHSKDTIFLSARLCLVYLFLINYQYKMKRLIDSILFETTIGYTTLPVGYVENSIEHWVCNDIFVHGTWLSFHAGEVEKGKNHAVIKHKGKHVMNVRLLTSKHSLRLPRNPHPRL